jgi:hypothetical protein
MKEPALAAWRLSHDAFPTRLEPQEPSDIADERALHMRAFMHSHAYSLRVRST